MAVTTIPWGDGSGDNIYLTYPSASGDQTIQVSSDALQLRKNVYELVIHTHFDLSFSISFFFFLPRPHHGDLTCIFVISILYLRGFSCQFPQFAEVSQRENREFTRFLLS